MSQKNMHSRNMCIDVAYHLIKSVYLYLYSRDTVRTISYKVSSSKCFSMKPWNYCVLWQSVDTAAIERTYSHACNELHLF